MIVLTLLLVSCGFAPMPRTFVIGGSPSPLGVRSETGRPIIELRTVSVPDYADSTDILRRVGPNEVAPSPTGRWGERLSLGLTDALSAALSRRLPGRVVTTQSGSEPDLRLIVDFETVDIEPGGVVRGTVRWRIIARGGPPLAHAGQAAFSEAAGSADDAAVAAAMTLMVEHLADQIVVTIVGPTGKE
jgi:uncharacterized lipoprotein YmbA